MTTSHSATTSHSVATGHAAAQPSHASKGPPGRWRRWIAVAALTLAVGAGDEIAERLAEAGSALGVRDASSSWRVVDWLAPNAADVASASGPASANRQAEEVAVDQEPVVLPGNWRTLANGDDVLALSWADGVLWAGTRAGGLVRWDPATGTYTQFLRPQDPLASNTIYDIAIDDQGRKWLATVRGLTMFDDKGTPERADDIWRTYNRENTFGGLPTDDLRAVAVDGDLIWVGGHQVEDRATGEWRGGGLGRLNTQGTARTDDDTWAPIRTFAGTRKEQPNGSTDYGLVSDNIADLAVTEGGRLWVATTSHRVYDDETGHWPAVHGGITLVETQGTMDVEDDVLTGISCEDKPLDVACHVQGLAVDAQGWMWAGTRGRGVLYWNGTGTHVGSDGSQRFTERDGLPDNDVLAVVPAPAANQIWIATASGGLARLDHGAGLPNRNDDDWLSIDSSDGLSRKRVQALAVGGGSVWAGTGSMYGIGGGIAEVTGDAVERTLWTSSAQGGRSLVSNFLFDVAIGGAGSQWAGHVWLAGGSTEQKLFGSGAVDLDTKGTADPSDDEMTVYTAASTDPDGAAPWAGLAGDNVQSVVIDGDAVWLGSTQSIWDGESGFYVDGGVSVFDGGQWTSRNLANSDLSHGAVSSLTLGCSGDLWIGTGSPWEVGQGADQLVPGDLHDRSGDSWTHHVYPDVPSNRVTDVSVNCDAGQVWVAAEHHSRAGRWSDGGASQFDLATEQWTLHDTRNGLVSFAHEGIRAEAMSAEAGPDGTAWVGTYGTEETTEAVLIQTKPFWPAVLNTWDGSTWSASVFPGLGWVSDIAQDPDGRLWVAASRGGVARDSIDPENWRDDREVPGVMLKDGDNWLALNAATSGLPSNDITAFAVAPDGVIWAVTQGWGAARYDPRDVAPTPTPTTDAPSPTPTLTPTITPTRDRVEPTSTSTGVATTRTPGTPTTATSTPTRRPPDGLTIRIYAPAVEQR